LCFVSLSLVFWFLFMSPLRNGLTEDYSAGFRGTLQCDFFFRLFLFEKIRI